MKGFAQICGVRDKGVVTDRRAGVYVSQTGPSWFGGSYQHNYCEGECKLHVNTWAGSQTVILCVCNEWRESNGGWHAFVV